MATSSGSSSSTGGSSSSSSSGDGGSDSSLRRRFGNPAFYEDLFNNTNRSNINQNFAKFHRERAQTDKYEAARQQFLSLLSQNKMLWQPTNEELDLDVDVSRIYRRDPDEHIAFMRIRPKGFRAERVVPEGKVIVFHLLMGNVIFSNKSKVRPMSRGKSITIQEKTTYSIRCPSVENSAYLIFRLQQK